LNQDDAELAEVVCQNLAVACREAGEPASALSWQQQSIAWWSRRASVNRGREDDELARLACDLTGRGCDEFAQHNFDLAESLWRRALAIEEWRGSWEAQAVDCGNLGLLAAVRGDLTEGIRWLRKSLRLHRLMFDQRSAGTDLMNLAELYRLEGDFHRSKKTLRLAVRCFEQIGAEPLRDRAVLRLKEAQRIESVLRFDPSLN
jgi:tetratricopeptide (TPR) repeat protein